MNTIRLYLTAALVLLCAAIATVQAAGQVSSQARPLLKTYPQPLKMEDRATGKSPGFPVH